MHVKNSRDSNHKLAIHFDTMKEEQIPIQTSVTKIDHIRQWSEIVSVRIKQHERYKPFAICKN